MSDGRHADRGSEALIPARAARGLRGAIVSPQELASQAGLAILRAGGGAVDAAIATNAALAVVAADKCGLGGDAFWLIWDGSTLHGLNGSGRSGAAATSEAARAAGLEEMPLRGPWTVTVPGAVRSWGDAHRRFGRLDWADLLAPAIDLAAGFPATPGWCAAVERGAAVYGADSDWARTFRPHGRGWLVGERVAVPALRQTLERLAADGPDAAYEGPLADGAAAYLTSRGSPLTAADFREHASDWTEPVRTEYRGATATSHPANSCGPIALLLLDILGRLDPPPPDAFDGRGCHDARWVHLGLEAARLAHAERDALLTDPDRMSAEALERLGSGVRARELAGRLDPERRAAPIAASLRAGGGTAYMAAADRWGGAVSLIESNYAGFGSGLVDPATGIGYQNRGAFFRLDPRHANALEPRKRTLHTLTPGMLFRDGRPWIVHGSMGGELQPQIFAQFVSGVVDGGLDIATQVAAPRWAARMRGHFEPPIRTILESRFPSTVAEGLAARGHDVEWAKPFDSGMGHEHAIELPGASPEGAPGGTGDGLPGATWDTGIAAFSDPRSEGGAAVW
jgi:gamma-glutamyltranspeptidase